MTSAKTEKPQAQPEPDNDEAQDDFEPVLDIDTLAPTRKTVRIRTPEDREGQLHEMLDPDELGIEDEQVFRSELREFSTLLGKQDKLTSAEKKRLLARLDSLTAKVLLAPPEILAQLNPRKKQKVITNFTGALFADDAAAVDQAMMARLVGSTMAS